MTNEQKERLSALYKDLDSVYDNPELYKEFVELNDMDHAEYFERNKKAFDEFYNAHIKGKAWDEMRPGDWDTYSDWYKDMYGYRPRFS